MVWCGTTPTRLRHKADEHDTKKTSISDSVPSRVTADLSVYPKNLHQGLPEHGMDITYHSILT